MDIDRKQKAVEAVKEAFVPLLEMLCRRVENLEVFIEDKDHGVLRGLEINVRAHKFDSPRIYGKSRSMFSALGVIAESMGYSNRYPIRLGLLLDPIAGTEGETEARLIGDRSYPINGKKPIDHIQTLLATVSNQLFTGLTPQVRFLMGDSGSMRMIISMSPQNPKIVQRQWAALSVVFKSICAPYAWMPTIEIDQSMPLPERR